MHKLSTVTPRRGGQFNRWELRRVARAMSIVPGSGDCSTFRTVHKLVHSHSTQPRGPKRFETTTVAEPQTKKFLSSQIQFTRFYLLQIWYNGRPCQTPKGTSAAFVPVSTRVLGE